MKKTTKILIAILCAAILVTASVAGVLAYLIDKDEVVNTFTVGDVQIELDEADVNPDGTVIAGADRVKENDYHLIPGSTYVKDPTLTVKADSEESYVRLLVTISKANELKAIFGDDFLPENYVAGWDKAIWVPVGITADTTANTLTYEFRYHTTVDASESTDDIVLEPLFTEFTLPGIVTNEELKTLQGDAATGTPGLTITVEGHAIQTNALATADEAWAAFEAQLERTANP